MTYLPRIPAVRAFVLFRDAIDSRLVVTVVPRAAGRPPRQLRHIPMHSLSGFECGYAGSGPADLALAIAAELLRAPFHVEHYRAPDKRAADAWSVHQPVKRRFIVGVKLAPGESAELDALEINLFILAERGIFRGHTDGPGVR